MTETVGSSEPIHLPSALDSITSRVRSAELISLNLDFDGTLAPIVQSPELAHIDPLVRQTLGALSEIASVRISILSGRSLNDVRRRIDLDDLVYAGNHGLEIEGHGLFFREPTAESLRERLKEISAQLKSNLNHLPGVQVEDKGITTSIHYRRVQEELRSHVERIVREKIQEEDAFVLREGKMIFEVYPRVDWNKGKALRWITNELRLTNALPIYLGDDVTDEDAFAVLPQGITIRVGEHAKTNARYRLNGIAEVRKFLAWLLKIRTDANTGTLQGS